MRIPFIMLPVRRSVVAVVALVTVATALSVPRYIAGATPPPTPSQPGAITVTGTTSSSATLSWGASTDALGIEGYQIYRQAPGASSASLIATTDGGVAHYAATHLFANSSYTFQVVAIDTAAQSSPSQSTTFSTSPDSNTTPPAPPSATSVAAHAFSDTRIDVLWAGSPTADVAGYRVLRDGTVVAEVDLPGGLRYSDNAVTAGTYHQYTIESVDSAGLVSAPTAFKSPAGATALATGTATIARGPYLSNVSGTSAVVSWWTNIPTAGVVKYGTASPSTSVTDSAGSVQHHSVALTGLAPGSLYHYTVGNGTLTSTAATIRTAAPAGTSFSFAAIGDFGGASPGESQNAANIAGAGTSFVQTLGDNIYASSGLPDPDFTTRYSDYDARFFKQFGPVVNNQAFFPANGNQEYYGGGAFWRTFPMPGTNHSWYSYDWGSAHITVIDSELAFDPSSPQYSFIQQDLTAHQDATWRIVIMQRPPYSSTSAASSSNKADQYLAPLFESEHVALVLSGNSHNYERSYPLTAGHPAAGGVTYVVSGGGGNGHNPFTIPAPSWSAARDDTRYEYAKVSVSPSALRVDAIDAATNTAFDTTTIPAASTPGALVPLDPKRLLDTRNATGAPAQAVAAHGTVHLQVTGGSTGVPVGASAVAINVTATRPTASGSLTVYPDGTTEPVASNLNYQAGQTTPNLVIVKVGTDGKIALTNNSAGTVHLVGDLTGYFVGGTPTAAGALVPLDPKRLLDTRNATGAPAQAVAAHGTVHLQVTGGSTGVPVGASAVAINVTATRPTASGSLTVYPDGTTEPVASNLNYQAGQTTPNLVIVKVGTDGKIALTNNSAGTVHLVGDLTGYFVGGTPTAAGALVPLDPKRLLDTRNATGAPAQAVAAHGTVHLQVTGGSTGVPVGASAVAINVTATRPTASGSLTVYPDGTTEPVASNLNYQAGQTTPNLVIVKVGTDGKIALTNNSAGTVHLVGDLTGYFG